MPISDRDHELNRAYAEELVAQAPPLDEEQRHLLLQILRPPTAAYLQRRAE